MSTQLRASQIKDLTLTNLQIATTAAIELSKLEKSVLPADGTVALTGNLQLGNHKITGLARGTAGTDAITYAQAQELQAGIAWKEPVVAATTENVTLSGVQTVDGVSLSVGDRVLVKNQTAQAENGIYIVGSAAWSRSPDADNSPVNELKGAAVLIYGGAQGQTAWTVNTPVGDINIDPVVFVQFNGAAAISAGDALVKAGNTLNVVAASTGGLSVAPDAISILLAPASALNTTSAGLALDASVAGGALDLAAGVLNVITANNGGIEVVADALNVKLPTNSGLSTTTGGLAVGGSSAITVAGANVSVHLATASGMNTSAGLAIDASAAGAGLLLTAGVFNIVLDSTPGLAINADKLAVSLAANSGLNTAAGLAVDASIAGEALSLTGGILAVNVASTGSVQVVADELSVKLATNSALNSTSAGLSLDASVAGAALTLTSGVLDLALSSSAGLQIVADQLSVKLAANSGLSVGSTGLTVDVAALSGGGLQFVDGQLQVNVVTNEVATTSDDVIYAVANTPVAGTLQVYLNGQLQLPGVTKDYTYAAGAVTFNSPNTSYDIVTTSYFK